MCFVFRAFLSSLQGPKSEDDVADGAEAEADEADELSGYEPESDGNTMTVLPCFTCSFLYPLLCIDSELLSLIVQRNMKCFGLSSREEQYARRHCNDTNPS